MRFNGKTVLIVGGTSGIGEAAASLFASEGASVFVTGRRAAVGEAVAASIRANGGEGRFIAADIRSADDCHNMVSEVIKATGQLDIAFNNAGILHPQISLIDMDESLWDNVLSVDLKGYFLAMKSELQVMVGQKSGVIVNMSSVNGVQGSAFACAYSAAKHGIIGLTRSAALEYAGYGIRINAICPGAVETDMLGSYTENPEIRESVAAMHALNRIATAKEIAASVLSLASDDMSFMTGQAVGVDGGMTAGFPLSQRPVDN